MERRDELLEESGPCVPVGEERREHEEACGAVGDHGRSWEITGDHWRSLGVIGDQGRSREIEGGTFVAEGGAFVEVDEGGRQLDEGQLEGANVGERAEEN